MSAEIILFVPRANPGREARLAVNAMFDYWQQFFAMYGFPLMVDPAPAGFIASDEDSA